MLPSDPRSSETTPLGFDEFVGILVAFATIGAVLFWSFSRKDADWNLDGLLAPSSTPSAFATEPGFGVKPTVSSNLNGSPSPTVTDSNQSANTLLIPDATTGGVVAVPPQASTINPPSQVGPVIIPPLSGNIAPNNQVAPVVVPPPSSNTTEPQTAPTVEQIPTTTPPIAFKDVPADYWGRHFIDALSSRGLIKGFPDNSFKPDLPVSRAEFAAIIQQVSEKKLDNTPTAFKDIPEKFWATPAISQAIGSGFLKGYPNGTFNPDQKISRVQVLVSLVSGLKLNPPASANQFLSIYKDAKDIPKYATDKVAAATANNLVVNHPDKTVLAPNKDVTRAEVAAMVYQTLVQTGKLQPLQDPNIVTVPR
ncbi:S-layer homology domain-containing protein [Aetokthonos hydrillicola Thurmond2011]|uniref:S-layer homology domain-containing protein n=1 Tax=Aetokthonos hydrillicola Thurmond2011 TaxID=2712845 RepID=A0AAP5I6Y0_9CYAN|nr:S-layer homology domain-containing protein [Aetokthonos hydrillicola]MBO3463559.1 S-layer homology domain-containing protein [Aetokthonos hydrillicola CCALA 1050]MBW4588700.1 S-layer homology domain-containing protein [Aetokthonos hydrillicola CCALA 1050]MDR9895966.1 S-layer homology domain-containing protein [Aetokthonos hydrillicola Thurmond2011]